MMIQEIVNIITNSDGIDEDGVIRLEKYVFQGKDLPYLKYLKDNNCFESFVDFDGLQDGDEIQLDIVWAELCALGVYDTKERFIDANQYKSKSEYYIYEIKAYNNLDNSFIITYGNILKLIDTLQTIADHKLDDGDCKLVILSRKDISIIIPLQYSAKDIQSDVISQKALIELINTLNEHTEKQRLYINELIDATIDITEKDRFVYLLKNVVNINSSASAAFDFYLSNYSSNKLKFEIDSKAIDFTRQIQSVINDAQTKLIAIPTAFVLAVSVIDFHIISVKNIVTVTSLYIFAFLIQLFLNNQKEILVFIKSKIDEFKATFTQKNIETISKRFQKVDGVLKKQQQRLCLIELILWAIPISLTILLTELCLTLKILLLPIFPCILLAIRLIMK